MPRFDTQPTPNPNSLKITTEAGPFIPEGMESFSSASEAADHPLGQRLFAVTGIANVFILPQFLTVTKHPAASWDDVMTQVRSVLTAYFEHNAPAG